MNPPFELTFETDMNKIMDELCTVESLINLDLSIPSERTDFPVFVTTDLDRYNKSKPLF